MKLLRLVLIQTLIFGLIFNSGCIHTEKSYRERLSAESIGKSPDRSISSEKVQIKGLVYNESELPLSDFFRRLSEGEFKKAFQDLSLAYKPSNIYSSIVSEMISAGLVPVYVEIKNTGMEPLQISEKNFVLGHGKQRISPLAAREVPSAIEHFSPKAALANVYNTVVVTLVIITIMVILASLRINSWPNFGSSSSGSGSGSSSNSRVWNDTTVKKFIDYQDYLITSREIAPGESYRGLLFFEYRHASQKQELELIYLSPSHSTAKD